jgi:hypothetical protein
MASRTSSTPSTFDALGGGDGQPAECGTHGDVLIFYEAKDGGVEVEGVVLIFNHYAGEADLHGVLLGDLVWRVGVEEQRTLDHEGCNYS